MMYNGAIYKIKPSSDGYFWVQKQKNLLFWTYWITVSVHSDMEGAMNRVSHLLQDEEYYGFGFVRPGENEESD